MLRTSDLEWFSLAVLALTGLQTGRDGNWWQHEGPTFLTTCPVTSSLPQISSLSAETIAPVLTCYVLSVRAEMIECEYRTISVALKWVNLSFLLSSLCCFVFLLILTQYSPLCSSAGRAIRNISSSKLADDDTHKAWSLFVSTNI